MRSKSLGLLFTGLALGLAACGEEAGRADGDDGSGSGIPGVSSAGGGSASGSGEASDDGDGDGATSTSGVGETAGDDGLDDGASGGIPKFDIGNGGTGSDVVCEELSLSAEPIPPDVMLVLDRSGSMQGNRWNDLLQATETLLNQYNAQVNFGARFLPSIDGGSDCGYNQLVEVPVAAQNAQAIIDEMNGTNPSGNTPYLPALQAAFVQLRSLGPDRGAPVVILVADGETNGCSDAAQIRTELADQFAADPSIPTYAISVGGQVNDLSGFAMSGGTGNYIATDNLAELTAAIDQILNEVISCTITLDPPPELPDLVEVEIDGTVYPQVQDCASGNGWVYTDETFGEIELCGNACTQLRATGAAAVSYQCPEG